MGEMGVTSTFLTRHPSRSVRLDCLPCRPKMAVGISWVVTRVNAFVTDGSYVIPSTLLQSSEA